MPAEGAQGCTVVSVRRGRVGDVEDEGDVAGLEEGVQRGFYGGGEDSEGVVSDELVEDGDVVFRVDGAEVHFDGRHVRDMGYYFRFRFWLSWAYSFLYSQGVAVFISFISHLASALVTPLLVDIAEGTRGRIKYFFWFSLAKINYLIWVSVDLRYSGNSISQPQVRSQRQ